MAAGGDCVDDIALLAADEGLCRLLGRELPSADTILNFLYAFHDEHLLQKAEQRREADQIAFIPSETGCSRAWPRSTPHWSTPWQHPQSLPRLACDDHRNRVRRRRRVHTG
jgi:hypothetical protein